MPTFLTYLCSKGDNVYRLLRGFFAFIGFFAVIGGLLAAYGLFQMEEREPVKPQSIILVLDLDQPIVEENNPSPLELAMHDQPTSLIDILHAIDRAKGDASVKALVARFGSTQPSLAQAQEIRAALARFRSSGKPTYAFAPSYGSFGLGGRAYYLASAFEHIWLQPVGSVGLTGIAMQSPFIKTGLDKIGVTADFMQREEYKSFMEAAQRDSYSPHVRTMIQGMIDDFANQISSGIAESRKWDEGRVKRLMAQGPFTDEEAMKAGLVTRIGYVDELTKEIEQKVGKDAERVNVATYLEYGGGKGGAQPKAKVALIYGTGLIVDRDDGPGEIAGEKVLGADKIAGAFDDAAEDKSIKAIIFRVDSPGGSPEASETIRRAVITAQGKGKPVFVSMGGVAASGGYWISMNADQIIAQPGTITGSIGVLSGKFVAGGLMQKLGVNFETIKTTENAGMWSMNEGFTPAQRERVNALLDQTYKAFISNVADARKIPMAKMPDIAKGRVWTGAQAAKIGLVDQLGGYDVALGAVRKRLKLLDNDPVALVLFPARESPFGRALKFLKNVGGDFVLARSALVQWQALQSQVGPVVRTIQSPSSSVVRMPTEVLRVVE